MDSLSQLLSTPLLEFTTSDNNEWPDELDMLLGTLSDSDIQLLDNTDTNKLQQHSTVANASNDISCRDTCSSSTHAIDHTSSTRPTSAFAVTNESDLKQLKDKNKNKNTVI